MSDIGFGEVSALFNKRNFTSCDISLCRDITDGTIVNLAQNCPNLKYLNLCGLSRVADKGVRAITTHCWFMETLNLEDIFLFDDNAFWYNHKIDGRLQANQEMLIQLKSLNLRDCVCITDFGMKGIAERCRFIEYLNLRGCHKLTDKSLEVMTLTQMER